MLLLEDDLSIPTAWHEIIGLVSFPTNMLPYKHQAAGAIDLHDAHWLVTVVNILTHCDRSWARGMTQSILLVLIAPGLLSRLQ
jgi:hypothetical protein